MKRLLWFVLPLLLISCQPALQAETLHGFDIDRLSQAIYKAEGGTKAKKPYGILSVPCEGKAECGKICRNTIRNNLKRWDKAGRKEPYLEFLSRRYAPTKNATNDPNGLNQHWLGNVSSLYNKTKS